MMDEVASGSETIPNYESKLTVLAGVVAGVFGALSIMVAVAGILVLGGRDIFTAARLIATVVYGPDAAVGIAPIIVGTVIHLITGGGLGAIFAIVVPCLPRAFWVVAGLIYGLVAWVVSSFIILPVIAPPMIAADANIYVLLFAHVVYGFVIGVAGTGYGLWWRLPKWMEAKGELMLRRKTS